MSKKKPIEGKVTANVKIWRPVYTKVVMLTQRNQSTQQISDETGLSTSMIVWLKKTVAFQQKYDDIVERTRKDIRNAVDDRIKHDSALNEAITNFVCSIPDAVETVLRIMKEGTSAERIRYDAAKEILHIAGLKPVEIKDSSRDRDYTPEEITSALATIRELESITNRLSNKDSEYILTEPKKPKSRLPRSVSPATDESSSKTSQDRPETGPA